VAEAPTGELDSQGSTMADTDTETETKRRQLERFLRRRAGDGAFYFKSRYVAEEVGLSAKEIGALMPRLCDSVEDLRIEPWSYTSATTWYVEREIEATTE
jgi:hypothetical protein